MMMFHSSDDEEYQLYPYCGCWTCSNSILKRVCACVCVNDDYGVCFLGEMIVRSELLCANACTTLWRMRVLHTMSFCVAAAPCPSIAACILHCGLYSQCVL